MFFVGSYVRSFARPLIHSFIHSLIYSNSLGPAVIVNAFFQLRNSIYLLIYSANIECRGEMMKCEGESPTSQCISMFWLCDGRNHCGNNWDEDEELCGQYAYYTLSVDKLIPFCRERRTAFMPTL